MDIRNSSGALVSLLNDSSVEASSGPARLPSLLGLHSRTSSFASTPIISSPPTPQLVRSDSSDSATMQRTPSPVTPVSFGFDGIPAAPKQQDASFPHQPSFFPPAKDSSSMYPPIPQHTNPSFAYAAPGAAPAQGLDYNAAAPSQSTLGGEPRRQSTPKAPGKKNQYPCPLAKQYNCSDHFTTSGHAARHAKKHTGKKDAFCPECNKAFTRKDNMEQHRRTHQNGRTGSSKSSTTDPSNPPNTKRPKTSHPPKSRPKPPPLQQAPTAQMLDSPISPASSYGFADPPHPLQPLAPPALSSYPPELLQQSPYPQSSPYPPVPLAAPYYDPAATMSGLDKLAMAASGESPPGESPGRNQTTY